MRLFFAIDLPIEVKEKLFLIERDFLKYNLPVKWVEKDNFHITLAFLGNQRLENLDTLVKIGEQTALSFKPFFISLKGIGAFPSLKWPRVIWVGLEEIEEMQKIYEILNKNLLKNGFQIEKKDFLPHITIGRARKKISNFENIVGRTKLKKNLNIVFEVNGFALWESKLSPLGSNYNQITSFQFKK